MNDYAIKGGAFLEVTEKLFEVDFFKNLYLQVNQSLLNSIDESKPIFEQIKNLIIQEESDKPTKPKSKTKYSCSCSNIWGKPSLDIKCCDCGESFKEQ